MIRFRLGFESFSVATLTLTHGGQSETTGGVFRKDAEGLLLRFMPDCERPTRKCSFLRSEENLLEVCIVDSRDKPVDVTVAQVEWSSDINWLREER
jgi:hypothetical protein